MTQGLSRLFSELNLSPLQWLAVIAPVFLVLVVIALNKRG